MVMKKAADMPTPKRMPFGILQGHRQIGQAWFERVRMDGERK